MPLTPASVSSATPDDVEAEENSAALLENNSLSLSATAATSAIPVLCACVC